MPRSRPLVADDALRHLVAGAEAGLDRDLLRCLLRCLHLGSSSADHGSARGRRAGCGRQRRRRNTAARGRASVYVFMDMSIRTCPCARLELAELAGAACSQVVERGGLARTDSAGWVVTEKFGSWKARIVPSGRLRGRRGSRRRSRRAAGSRRGRRPRPRRCGCRRGAARRWPSTASSSSPRNARPRASSGRVSSRPGSPSRRSATRRPATATARVAPLGAVGRRRHGREGQHVAGGGAGGEVVDRDRVLAGQRDHWRRRPSGA